MYLVPISNVMLMLLVFLVFLLSVRLFVLAGYWCEELSYPKSKYNQINNSLHKIMCLY